MRSLGELKSGRALRTVRLLRLAAALCAVTLLLLPLARIEGQSANGMLTEPESARISSIINNSELTVLTGSTHPAVRNAIDNGRMPSTAAMDDLILVLKRSAAQQAALENFNAQQYDPHSPQYHHWLTPAEYGAHYGVSDADLSTISIWLQNQGFTIEEIPPSRTSIRFSGTVGHVENAFHTEMHALTSNGVAHFANVSDISIPTSLTPVVAGVKSLHNFFAKPQHHTAPMLQQNTSGSTSGAHSEYSAGSGYQLLVPYDMATIYNYKSLWSAATPINGTGQTIAIAGTSNIVLSDIATFRSLTGLPAKVPSVIVTNSDPGTTALLDDRMENTLDVEWSGGAAPGASIVLVTSSQSSPSTDALYASESYIINHNVAKIMSVSYGECELWMGTAGNQEYANLWQQAYTQGIAVFVSSGDSMAAVCDQGYYNPSADNATEYGMTVSGLASTPYNVSVGGTDFNSTSANWNASNNGTNLSNAVGYIPEVPWNDSVTNPLLISDFDSQLGVNYSAEQWANYLLTNYGISSGLYDEVIPPVGGSGGISSCTTSNGSTSSSCSGGYAKPSWQAGVTGISTTDKRTVPDVSFFASNAFLGVAYLICDTQPPGYSSTLPCSYPANALDMAVGGTSVSSPVMAGVMALINQKAGTSQGNPNPTLYSLAAKQNYANCSAEKTTNSNSCYFNDIDTGTIATVCYGGTVSCTPATNGDKLGILPGYAATVGYDKATGLGSLNVANVVNNWPGVATTAVASLTPTSLTFSTTGIGASSATQTVTLANTGTGAMSISGISLTGTYSTSYSQTNNCGATLAASASCVVTVTFKPTTTGTLAATLSFADNAANSPQSVALSGTGMTANTPVVGLSTTSLSFASTTVNTNAATQTVTLSNTGTGAMSISGISLAGTNPTSFSQTNNCGVTLAVGVSCTVTVTFRPTTTGALSARLNFADNAANSPQTVTLSGTGIAPVASVSPASVTFPSTKVGAASASQTVTLTNTGTATLTLSSSPSLTGTSASLFHGSTSCATSLAPGSSCTTTLTFNPTAVGTFTATLSFADNAANSPQTVALSGIGVGVPVVSLTPTSLAFATTNDGATSAVQTVTLRNTGTASLAISGITLTGTNPTSFTQTNNCASSLAASASCTISITFKPAAAGTLKAALTLIDNAAASPQSVALTGTGIAPMPVVSLSSATLSFPNTVVNTASVSAYSAADTLTLTNTGTGTLSLASVTLGGSNPTSFAEINNCPASLAVGGSCTILVRFAPTTTGSKSATLVFTYNATPATQTVTLSGTGISATALSLSATTLSFGTVTAKNTSTAQTITITNNSTISVALTSMTLSGTGAALFEDASNCPPTLASNSSCIVLVAFSPTSAGATTASLTLTSNNPTATATVALSGTGH